MNAILLILVGFVIGAVISLMFLGNKVMWDDFIGLFYFPPKKKFHHEQNVVVFKGFYKGKRGKISSYSKSGRYYTILIHPSGSNTPYFGSSYTVHYSDIKPDPILDSDVMKDINGQ